MVKVIRAYKEGSSRTDADRRKYAVPVTGYELASFLTSKGHLVDSDGNYAAERAPFEEWDGKAAVDGERARIISVKVFRFMPSSKDKVIIAGLERMMANTARDQTLIRDIPYEAKIELLPPHDCDAW